MKWLILALLVLAVPVDAQQGKVADTYIRGVVDPEFQYRSDQDVVVPIQVRYVRDGIPQQDLVQLSIVAAQGRAPIDIPGGQGWLHNGVKPYPATSHVNFGKLESGLYQMTIIAEAGGMRKEIDLEFDVVKPPRPYYAALEGRANSEAMFIFQAKNEADIFKIEVYRDGPGGRSILERFEGNATELEIPYIPGEGVKVDVTDPNGWVNSANRHKDWITGTVTYAPYIWNPDFHLIKNYEYQSWREAIVPGLLLVFVAAAYWFGRRRSTA